MDRLVWLLLVGHPAELLDIRPVGRRSDLERAVERASIAVGDPSLPKEWRERIRRVWLAGEHMAPVDQAAISVRERELLGPAHAAGVPLGNPTLWRDAEIYTANGIQPAAAAARIPRGLLTQDAGLPRRHALAETATEAAPLGHQSPV